MKHPFNTTRSEAAREPATLQMFRRAVLGGALLGPLLAVALTLAALVSQPKLVTWWLEAVGVSATAGLIVVPLIAAWMAHRGELSSPQAQRQEARDAMACITTLLAVRLAQSFLWPRVDPEEHFFAALVWDIAWLPPLLIYGRLQKRMRHSKRLPDISHMLRQEH